MTTASIKKKILDGIKFTTQKLGYELVQGNFGSDSEKCACAIGCLLKKQEVNLDADLNQFYFEQAAKILKVSEDWIESFTEGFDCLGRSKDSKVPEAWDLGLEVYQESFKSKENQ